MKLKQEWMKMGYKSIADLTIKVAKFAREKPQKAQVELATIKHAKSYLNRCILKALKTGDREMNSYPYISTTMNNLLFYAKDTATLIGDESNQHSHGFKLTVDESKFENNTAEYLANTCGEVKSKEHAEFIVKLAVGSRISGDSFGEWVKSFIIIRGELCFTGRTLDEVKKDDPQLKQITIPLPPECESADEWPKVNDDVFYNGQKWTFVAKHNDMAMLFWTGDEYCTAKISELQKPKTPEQELFESFWKEVGLFMNQSNLNKKIFESAFINNVTKKPQ